MNRLVITRDSYFSPSGGNAEGMVCYPFFICWWITI